MVSITAKKYSEKDSELAANALRTSNAVRVYAFQLIRSLPIGRMALHF